MAPGFSTIGVCCLWLPGALAGAMARLAVVCCCCCCAAAASALQLGFAGSARAIGAAHTARSALSPIALDADEELDAADTTSSWDEEVAAMRAWEAAQAAKRPAPAPAASESGVDEEAHFGFAEDAEDDTDRILRQVAEKQAALALLEGSLLQRVAGAEVGAESGDAKVILGSLTAVLNSLTRLTEAVAKLNAKVDALAAGLRAAAPSAAESAPPAEDGEVREDAWFDDDPDDQDGPDWRDVRRLNSLLNDEEPPPK
jgi:hypothetical protein